MESIKTIGVMTGNSLDAVDVVLSEFSEDSIQDISGYSLDYPQDLKSKFQAIRRQLAHNPNSLPQLAKEEAFINVVNEYTQLVAQAVNALLSKHRYNLSEIAAIGFSGQTCGHFPPSSAKGKQAYTIQLGNPNLLANLTSLPVIYDFRSDDILNGGEGAPLAPIHNAHLAKYLKNANIYPVAFCNGGNTGNISVVSQNQAGEDVVFGWDTGPFNHFPDLIVKTYYNEPYDKGGQYGSKGRIDLDLLRKLFNESAKNGEGKIFYLQTPPKSADPTMYSLPDLTGYKIEDILRTSEYLSVYGFFHSLQYIPPEIDIPNFFLAFGGGWKNPLIMNDFNLLLLGLAPVLPEHKEIFSHIKKRFKGFCSVSWSDTHGYSGQYMEARIMADLAYCKIKNIPFTTPQTTNCKTPTVCGQWCYPNTPQRSLFNRAYPGRKE